MSIETTLVVFVACFSPLNSKLSSLYLSYATAYLPTDNEMCHSSSLYERK